MGGASGNIGAIGFLDVAVTFSPHGVDQKKMLIIRCMGEGSTFFAVAVHLKDLAPYTENDEFICNLNDMR
jgi:hypothetical protein